MPEYTTVKVPHFAAVVPFNLTGTTGRPLYTVEHLVNENNKVVGMVCEGATPMGRCASCGDVTDDPTIRGTFTGYKFVAPWDKTANPNDSPKFDLVASIQGTNARKQVLDILTKGTA